MSAAFLAFAMGLGQGFLHGLGPDHCAAVATLGSSAGVSGDRRAAFRVALRFALGHAAVLGVLAAACLMLGVGLSETFERWAEVLGGVVLLAVALGALFFPGSLTHGHPHFSAHGQDHRHVRVGTAAGALMAVSGARGLLLAFPPLVIGGSLHVAAWTYLPGFTLGVMASMGGFGWLWSSGVSRLGAQANLWAHRSVSLASAGLGLFWIVSRV